MNKPGWIGSEISDAALATWTGTWENLAPCTTLYPGIDVWVISTPLGCAIQVITRTDGLEDLFQSTPGKNSSSPSTAPSLNCCSG